MFLINLASIMLFGALSSLPVIHVRISVAIPVLNLGDNIKSFIHPLLLANTNLQHIQIPGFLF